MRDRERALMSVSLSSDGALGRVVSFFSGFDQIVFCYLFQFYRLCWVEEPNHSVNPPTDPTLIKKREPDLDRVDCLVKMKTIISTAPTITPPTPIRSIGKSTSNTITPYNVSWLSPFLKMIFALIKYTEETREKVTE